MSRFYFDDALAKKAQEMGVQVHTNTLVTGIQFDGQYQVTLSSGETLVTKRLVLGTGRVTQLLDPSIQFLRNHSGERI